MAFLVKVGLSIFCGLPAARISAPILGAIAIPVLPITPMFLITCIIVACLYFIKSDKTYYIVKKDGKKDEEKSLLRVILITWLFMSILLLPFLFVAVKGICFVGAL